MLIAFTYLPGFVTLVFRGMPTVWRGRHRLIFCWLIFMQAVSPGCKTLEEMTRWTPAPITAWRFGRLLKAAYWNVHLLVSWLAGFVAKLYLRRCVLWSLPVTYGAQRGRTTMAISFKGAHLPQDIILMGMRWYVAYPWSYRHVEELREERGVAVDHATIQRWVVKYGPQLEEAFHRRKPPVWISWRMDEMYMQVKGAWRYLYRAVDKYGETIHFLLTEHRDTEAALRFLKKASRRNGAPETITIDGSDANAAAIKRYNQGYGTATAIRQVKYLNNVVEQDGPAGAYCHPPWASTTLHDPVHQPATCHAPWG
jgi:transposase-like protein